MLALEYVTANRLEVWIRSISECDGVGAISTGLRFIRQSVSTIARTRKTPQCVIW